MEDNVRPQPSVFKAQELESAIIKLDKEGFGLTAIARKLGISRGLAYGILAKARSKSVAAKGK